MTKLKMQTPNLTAQNIDKIAELFPNCITETVDENGQPKRAVNFPMLKQMLSGEVLDGDEAYEFTWVGKKASIVEANRPIRKTLRPCIEESRNWDETENLYIEGDNLEVLKLLQESYLGKVKMIYIDPPYNTGNDFIYRDDFKQTAAEYDEESGVFDEDENRLFKNTDSNGRFHSDWCSMIYPRLLLARNLLSDDGVIFISIDDNEQDNLKKICDEVFGASNFSATFIWTKTSTPPALSYKCRKTVEYILAYEKKLNNIKYFGSPLDGGDAPLLNAGNPKKTLLFPACSIHFNIIENGIIKAGAKERLFLDDDIIIENGINQNDVKMTGEFKWEQNTLFNEIKQGTYFLVKSDKFAIRFQRENITDSYKTPTNYLEIELNKKNGVGTNESADKELASLGLKQYFDYSKPYSLIQSITNMICKKEEQAIVLDFFSGSATTAHAVMQLNAEDGGNRKFIMVQLPEPCDEKSEAYKAGYKNICEIGKERIRRAGDKIKAETGADIDYGFRVFKVDDSNMNDIYYSVAELNQTTLASTLDNIKPDRSALDLLFGCLLDWGLPLSMPYKSEQLSGCTVHTYNEGDLLACFDMDIPEEVLVELAKRQPLRAVFRDSCFADSPAKINVFEIFKLYAPDCTVKVL